MTADTAVVLFAALAPVSGVLTGVIIRMARGKRIFG
jgi:hypothetical protein